MSATQPAPITIEPASIPVTIAYFEMPDSSLVGAGVLAGDTAVVLLNSDIQSGDVVLVHTPQGLEVLQYHTAPCERVKLRSLEFARSRKYVYTKKDAVVLGRVVQFVYEGKPIQLLINLRPVS
jgi:hydrogenase maturation factor